MSNENLDNVSMNIPTIISLSLKIGIKKKSSLVPSLNNYFTVCVSCRISSIIKKVGLFRGQKSSWST